MPGPTSDTWYQLYATAMEENAKLRSALVKAAGDSSKAQKAMAAVNSLKAYVEEVLRYFGPDGEESE